MSMRLTILAAVAGLSLGLAAVRSAEAAPRYHLAYWYEVGGYQNACCSSGCSCAGTGNHSIYVHVIDSSGNKLGNKRVEDADNPSFYGITNNNPSDKLGYVELPVYMSGTPALRVNDTGVPSDITPEMVENRAPTNGHYSWECAFMLVPDGVTVSFNQALLGTPNLSGGGCDIDAPFTRSCSYYDVDPLNWASDSFSLDSGASSYGQTFVATGDRVVIAKFQPTVGFLADLRYGVTIRQNGPGGTVVGTQGVSRLMKSDEYYSQIVTWPLSGPNAVVVTPGNTYYAEITRVDQAGGINVWRRNNNVYPSGQMYRAGSPVTGMDLVGRIICASTNLGPTGTIAGTVRDSSNQALPAVQVTAQPGNHTTTTGVTGEYTLLQVPVGTYSLTAEKAGYLPQTQTNITVSDSATTTVNFALSPDGTLPGAVTGTVRDLAGAPVGLAQVKLSNGHAGISAADGTYQVVNVAPGTYDVTAYAPTKVSQTVTGRTVPSGGSVVVDFALESSGRVAHILDDFNGNYIYTGDTLEESFQFGFTNHEFFPEGPPAHPERVLPPYTGTNHSQKFELRTSNDQFVSYFQTKSLYGTDQFLELTDVVAQNGWEPIELSQPITYIVYVRGANNIADPDDPNWYWRQTLGVHRPAMYAGTDQIDWKSANNDTWQMLRTSVTGLQNNQEQWITFESWYPAWLGGQVIDHNWMVWENLTIEYAPVGGIDVTPPGPVVALTATATAGKVTLSWQSPSDADFAGTRVCYRTDAFPTGINDGTLLADHAGSPDGTNSLVHSNLTRGQTYYYAAFAYDEVPNYSAVRTASATVPVGFRGDFDGDGDVDLAVAAHLDDDLARTQAGSVYVYRREGASYVRWQRLSTTLLGLELTNLSAFGATMVAADFDGDGKDELAISHDGWVESAPYSGMVALVGTDAEGTFVLQQSLSQSGLGTNERYDEFGAHLAIGDFDADGVADLAVAAPGDDEGGTEWSGRVYVFRGGAQLAPWRVLSPSQFLLRDAGFGQALAAGDLDGDGYDDLAIGLPEHDRSFSLAQGTVVVYRSTAGNPLQPSRLINGRLYVSPSAGNRAHFGRTLAALDMDGDGDDELAVGAPDASSGSNLYTGAVKIFRNASVSQSLWHTIAMPFPGAKQGKALAVGDFDGNGADDLAVSQDAYGNIGGLLIWKGRVSNKPALGEDYAGLFDAVAAADLDGDGRAELLASPLGDNHPLKLGYGRATGMPVLDGAIHQQAPNCAPHWGSPPVITLRGARQFALDLRITSSGNVAEVRWSRPAGGGDWVDVTAVADRSDVGLSPGTEYCYQGRTLQVGSDIFSHLSPPACFSTVPRIAGPTISLTGKTTSSLSVRMVAASGADRIRSRLVGGLSQTIAGTTVDRVFTGLSAGTQYCVVADSFHPEMSEWSQKRTSCFWTESVTQTGTDSVTLQRQPPPPSGAIPYVGTWWADAGQRPVRIRVPASTSDYWIHFLKLGHSTEECWGPNHDDATVTVQDGGELDADDIAEIQGITPPPGEDLLFIACVHYPGVTPSSMSFYLDWENP